MIYHIAIQGEWDAQADLLTYVPDRYRKDGFIHCSELQQLERGVFRVQSCAVRPTEAAPVGRHAGHGCKVARCRLTR